MPLKVINDKIIIVDYEVKTPLKYMRVKGIKKGNIIELLQEINLPDDQMVIVEIEEDNSKIDQTQTFVSLIKSFREQENLEEAEIIPENIFGKIRDSSSGREVSW